MFNALTTKLNKCCFDLSEVIAVEEINGINCKIYLKGGSEIVISIDYEIMENVIGRKRLSSSK